MGIGVYAKFEFSTNIDKFRALGAGRLPLCIDLIGKFVLPYDFKPKAK